MAPQAAQEFWSSLINLVSMAQRTTVAFSPSIYLQSTFNPTITNIYYSKVYPNRKYYSLCPALFVHFQIPDISKDLLYFQFLFLYKMILKTLLTEYFLVEKNLKTKKSHEKGIIFYPVEWHDSCKWINNTEQTE